MQPGHSHAKARTFSNSRSCVASQTSLVPASRPSSIVAPWHVTGRRLVKLEPRPPSGAPRPRVTWRSHLVPISAQFTSRDASSSLCGKREFTGPDWAPLLTKAGETAHTLRRSCATQPRHFLLRGGFMLRSPRPPIRPETKLVQSFLREGRPRSALLVALAHSPWAVAAMSGTGLTAIVIAGLRYALQ